MKATRKIKLRIVEIESAFDWLNNSAHIGFDDGPSVAFLDLTTGDGCGADVFLCDPRHDYLGRVCQWKQCAPGIRPSCQAAHCGRREYLNDDLQNVRLDAKLVAAPPLELWPEIHARAEMPVDVREELVASLQ